MQGRKIKRYSRYFARFSSTRSMRWISSPVFFFFFVASVVARLPMHPCAAIESPPLPPSIFSLSSSSPAFRLPFSSSSSTARHSRARIFLFRAGRPSIVLVVFPFSCEQRICTRRRTKNQSHVHGGLYICNGYYIYSDTVISKHFHIFLLSFAQMRVLNKVELVSLGAS